MIINAPPSALPTIIVSSRQVQAFTVLTATAASQLNMIADPFITSSTLSARTLSPPLLVSITWLSMPYTFASMLTSNTSLKFLLVDLRTARPSSSKALPFKTSFSRTVASALSPSFMPSLMVTSVARFSLVMSMVLARPVSKTSSSAAS